ncbi:hypothetical protein GCM10022243_31130 [Saccharothrix violaceirubra]|uniref:Uncharacterized protein n=1 Tax=Saccharothrix violaceirubra TaxID=413306 RepID=A0A7W7WXK9_9PSEU|nr:hypothetical protein [Saccharothrix violaceirubra]MBB4966738.1 hypothetical protein [Saccharothrix violaceirubra]
MLLAEHTRVSLDLVRDLIRPETGHQADDFTRDFVLDVDRENFRAEHPGIEGGAGLWWRRLADVSKCP